MKRICDLVQLLKY